MSYREPTSLEDALCAVITDRRMEDELRQARAIALSLATEVARDRSNCSHTHPGADAILVTAREFFDFIWNGGNP